MSLFNPAKSINWLASISIKDPSGKSIDIGPFIQQINIPLLQASPLDTATSRGIAKLYNSQPVYGDFDITFLLDDNWELYTILLESFFQLTRGNNTNFGAISIIGVDSYQIPRFMLEYDKVFVTSITDVQLVTSNTNDPIQINAQFSYSSMRFRKISTAGSLGIGSGMYTNGYYKIDGTWEGDSTMQLMKDYKVYSGVMSLLNGNMTSWSMALLGDDQVSVFVPDNMISYTKGQTAIDITTDLRVQCIVTNSPNANYLVTRHVQLFIDNIEYTTNFTQPAGVNLIGTFNLVDGLSITFAQSTQVDGSILITTTLYDPHATNVDVGTQYPINVKLAMKSC